MPNVGDLNINLLLHINEFNKNSNVAVQQLNKVNQTAQTTKSGVDKFGGVMQQHGKSILNYAAGLGLYNIALSTTKKVLVDSVNAWVQADSVNKKLLASLNNNTEAFKRLTAEADRYQQITIYDDETIKESMVFLANQNRTEEQIRKTIAAAVDYAAVTGKSLPDAVNELSGSLEGVTGRMGKYDERITKLTKEQLANGDAITIIGNKYKGFAEIVGETTEGKMKRFQNQLGELQEQIGRGLVEGIVELTDDLGALTVGIEGNGKAWEIIKRETGEAIKNFIKFGGALPTAITLLASLKDKLAGVRSVIRDVAVGMKEYLSTVSSLPSKIPIVGDYFNFAIQKADEYLNKLLQLIAAKKSLTEGKAELDTENYIRNGQQGNILPEPLKKKEKTSGTSNSGTTKEEVDLIEELLKAINVELENKKLKNQLDEIALKNFIDRVNAGFQLVKNAEDENKLLQKRAELLDELQNYLPPTSITPRIFERAQSDLFALEPGRSNRSKAEESPDQVKVKFEGIVNDLSSIIKNNLIATLLGGADSFGAKFIGYFQDAISLVGSIVSILTAIGNISSGGVLSFLGFAEGGYTGDGGKYEPAGIVHKGEFVIPQNMLNPTLLNVLETIRTSRNPSSIGNAYANGGLANGSIGSNVTVKVTNKGKLTEAIATDVVVLGTSGANIHFSKKGNRTIN